MSKLRLNQHTRNALTSFAFQKVRCAAEEQRLADAYEKAAPLVRAIVEAVYPPRDINPAIAARIKADVESRAPEHE